MNVDFNIENSILENIEHKVDIIKNEKYIYCKYKTKINIFTFGKLKLNLPFTVIAPPVSIDDVGFAGDVNLLISDLKKTNKFCMYLFLNLKQEHINLLSNQKVGISYTLSSCVFKNINPLTNNKFASFEEYITTLRSQYRRRLNQALNRGKDLIITKINNSDFDGNLYNLYLNVLKHNEKYKLETLPINFFKNSQCEIYTFKKDNKNLAFVMLNHTNKQTNFIFGGLDYNFRDCYDLYYNMLIFVLKQGIEKGSNSINFGQTAEDTKCRLGCDSQLRYIISFSPNPILNYIIYKTQRKLGNKVEHTKFTVFNILKEKDYEK